MGGCGNLHSHARTANFGNGAWMLPSARVSRENIRVSMEILVDIGEGTVWPPFGLRGLLMGIIVNIRQSAIISEP